MIRNFSDHSANERTFLAWVRTAIALMAFGFLAEKFDLFLERAAPSLTGRTLSLPGRRISTAKSCAREQDRESTSPLRGCWSFWAALYYFICRTPL
jgi:hypothetical protein